MFDLDGTLADTLADIAAAGNFMLSRFNMPPIDLDRYRYLAGQGIQWLVREALGPIHADKTIEGMSILRSYYADHPMDFARPFEGIPQLLDELVRLDLKLAVLSNKPDDRVQDLMRNLFHRWPFREARGQHDGGILKPDPTTALQICSRLKIEPDRWIYVGDTSVDMQTGRAAGMWTVGVTWGFRDEAELCANGAQAIIHHPLELLDVLDRR